MKPKDHSHLPFKLGQWYRQKQNKYPPTLVWAIKLISASWKEAESKWKVKGYRIDSFGDKPYQAWFWLEPRDQRYRYYKPTEESEILLSLL